MAMPRKSVAKVPKVTKKKIKERVVRKANKKEKALSPPTELAKKAAPPAPVAAPPPAQQQGGIGSALASGLANGVGFGVGKALTNRLIDTLCFRSFEWPSDAVSALLGGAVGIGLMSRFRRGVGVARQSFFQPRYVLAGLGGAYTGTMVNSFRLLASPYGWRREHDPKSGETYYRKTNVAV